MQTEAQPPGSAPKERNKQQDNEISPEERESPGCVSCTANTAGSSWESPGCRCDPASRDCSTQGMELLQCLVLQNDSDCTCKVLTGDSARAFHAGIIAQTAQLDAIHLHV